MNQHKVDRDSAEPVDLNNVRAKIRKIVRELSASPEASAVLNGFGKVMDGLASARTVLGRAHGFNRAVI